MNWSCPDHLLYEGGLSHFFWREAGGCETFLDEDGVLQDLEVDRSGGDQLAESVQILDRRGIAVAAAAATEVAGSERVYQNVLFKIALWSLSYRAALGK